MGKDLGNSLCLVTREMEERDRMHSFNLLPWKPDLVNKAGQCSQPQKLQYPYTQGQIPQPFPQG